MTKLVLIISCFTAASSAIFVRWADMPSLVLVVYRMFMTVLLLPGFLLKHRQKAKSLSKKTLLLCVASGICFGLHLTTYFASVRATSIASSQVLVNTEAFFIALLTYFIFKEKISLSCWTGIGIAFLGIVLIALTDAGGQATGIKGDILALTAAVLGAGYTIIGRKVRSEGVSTTLYTLLVYFMAGVTTLLATLFSGTPLFGYGISNYGCALGLAVFPTLLGHNLFSWALKYESASTVSTMKLLQPVCAAFYGIFLFQEVPGTMSIAGGVVTVLGIWLYIRAEEKKTAEK